MRSAKKTKNQFSQRLIALRHLHKMTQQQLADEICMSREMVNYLEGRASNPRAKTLRALAEYFGVTPDYFLLDETADTNTLLKQFRDLQALPPEERLKAEQLIAKFLEEHP